MGANISKSYSSLKSRLNLFKLFSEFSSQWSSQKLCFGLLKFLVYYFPEFAFVFVNMGPYMGAKT